MPSRAQRKLKKEIKVAQLAGYVSEHSAYHHGEQVGTARSDRIADESPALLPSAPAAFLPASVPILAARPSHAPRSR